MIRRYEAQKRMVMIAQIAEIAQDHYLARGALDAVELREALASETVTADVVEALQGICHTIENLKQQALTRNAREIRALDEQIALQVKILAGFQASYEVAANRKLNIERMKLQNEMLRRDVDVIDGKPLNKKSRLVSHGGAQTQETHLNPPGPNPKKARDARCLTPCHTVYRPLKIPCGVKARYLR